MGLIEYLKHFWIYKNTVIILITPLILLPLPLIGQTSVSKCAYALIIMAVYWTTEACPLAVTSLLPVILFPMMGIQTADQVSMSYMRQINFLFIGGLIMAVAIEEWNLHKRIALKILMLIGTKPCWLMLGFMLITAFLSMWISNTATTAMMIPIAVAVHRSTVDIPDKGVEEIHVIVEGQIDEKIDDEPRVNNYSDVEVVEQNTNADENKEPNKKEEVFLKKDKHTRIKENKMRKGMLLCVAYAANIGGFSTLIGTPSNLILPGALDAAFGEGTSKSIDFFSWFGFCFPVSLVCLITAWIWLQIRFTGISNLWIKGNKESEIRTARFISQSYHDLGPMKFGEFAILGHFIVLALLWITRDPKFISGWKDVFPGGLMKDSTSAIVISFSLFVFPSKNPMPALKQLFCCCIHKNRTTIKSSPALLQWKTAQVKIAWDVLFLLGAGFALAKACEDSKLTEWIGNMLSDIGDISPAIFALIISLVLSFVTEFTSNVSTASIFLPILCKLAYVIGIHPLYIAIPATISCSFAFSLPVATPPNAIAFSFGSLKVTDLITAGVILNFICVLILNVFLNTTGAIIFNFNDFTLFNTTNHIVGS